MLADASVRWVITAESSRELYETGVADVLTLDGDVAAALAGQSEENPRVRLTKAAAAYVIYTSGSTGQPKGVLVPHGAVVRLVCEPNYAELGQHVAAAADGAL